MRGRAVLSLVAFLLLTGGCEFSAEPDRVMDEASILKVVPEGLAVWNLGSEPRLVLGADESGPLFHRLSEAIRLADGRILAVDVAASRLYVFSDEGEHLDTWGAPGFGPGEFRYLSGVVETHPDTIVAFDYPTSRLTYFSGRGDVHRTVRVEPPELDDFWIGSYALAHVQEDGRALFMPRMLPVLPNPDPGVERKSLPVLSYGGRWDVFAPDLLWSRELWSDGRVQFERPFGAHSHVGIGGGTLFVAEGETGTVRGVRLDESAAVIMEVSVERPELPSEWIEGYIENRLVSLESASERREARAFWNRVDFPTHVAPLGGLLVNDDGRPWVRLADLAGEAVSAETLWLLLDPDVGAVARLRVPEYLTVLAIDRDELIGVRTDSLGVETVEVHSIDPGPRSPQEVAAGRPVVAGEGDAGTLGADRAELRSSVR